MSMKESSCCTFGRVKAEIIHTNQQKSEKGIKREFGNHLALQHKCLPEKQPIVVVS